MAIDIIQFNGTQPVKITKDGYTAVVSDEIPTGTEAGLYVHVVSQPLEIGTVTANAGSGTFGVSGTVISNIGTTNGLSLDATVSGLHVAQASTTSGQSGPLLQGATTTAAPSYTTAKTNPLSLTTTGALRVDNSAVTQPVSGTITANIGTGGSLSTAAKQPALGTAGTASSDVITIQGIASMTAVKTDSSATTQPVSGTVTANAGSGTFGISGTVTSNIGTTNGLSLDSSVNGLLVAQASTTSGQSGPLIQGATTTAAPSYTTAKSNPLSLTTAGALRVDNSAVTQPVSGTITANIGTSGSLSTAAKQPALGTAGSASSDVITIQGISSMTAVKVDGSAATQPVSGTITANAGSGTFGISGTVTANIGTSGSLALDATLAKLTITQGTALGSNTVNLNGASVTTAAPSYTTGQISPLSLTTGGLLRVDNSGVTQPVSGTITANIGTSGSLSTAAKQPALGTAGSASADVITIQGVASMTAVKVDNSAVTQPVSSATFATVAKQPALGTAGSASADVITIQGIASMTAVKTDASATTQPVSSTTLATAAKQPALGTAGTASADVISVQGIASATPLITTLGNTTTKTLVMKTGALTSTATTADQVILTYTVTSGKTFYIQYIDCIARLTTYATTATLFGTFSLEIVAGTKMYTSDMFNAGAFNPTRIEFTEPIFVTTGVVVRIVCTPAASTSFAWKGNFGGYEK